VQQITLAEQMLYSTVKLTAFLKGQPISSGTGFFMPFGYKAGQACGFCAVE